MNYIKNSFSLKIGTSVTEGLPRTFPLLAVMYSTVSLSRLWPLTSQGQECNIKVG